MLTAALSTEQRRATLAALASTQGPLDVVVIGGGVVGTGVALDAATRGLSVASFEAGDWASGTSSRSSKLIHGGLRYLEMLEFGLVREALRERALLSQRLAPHLVQPIAFLYPLRHRVWERGYAGVGVGLYDVLGRLNGVGRRIPGHRHLSRTAALRECPALQPDALAGAIRYHDALVDDARHTVAVARTAALYGAHVISRAEVVALIREQGRVRGVSVLDVETGERFDVRARHVVAAAGVWTDRVCRMLGSKITPDRIRMSKGVHLTVGRDRIDSTCGMILRTASSVLFVIPWKEHWIIGTTDTHWDADQVPVATSDDIDYLLAEVSKVLVRPLDRNDIQAVYAGLRPLVADYSASTSRISREHVVQGSAPGMTTVAGGKYTTYRVMAKDAVDAVCRDLGGNVPASCTEDVPLVGAAGFAALWNGRKRVAQRADLPSSTVEHLLRRHGSLLDEVLSMSDLDPAMLLPIAGAHTYLRAEVAYAVLAEGALHIEDVLERRTRISIETGDRGCRAADDVADIMTELLGWAPGRRLDEVEAYRAKKHAEVAGQDLYVSAGTAPVS